MLGPLFSLELVTGSRRWRYFVARVSYAVILFLVLWTIYAASQPYAWSRTQTAANVARDFFNWYSVLQLIAIMLLTPAMMAATIASERESRTLDYLLASPISGVEIVLSKLAARLLHVIFLLSAGVPVLALATLMGGIEPEKLVLVSLLTLSSLLAIAGMSIAISVWSRRTRDAVIKAYVILISFLVVPLLGMLMMASRGRYGAIGQWLAIPEWICGWLTMLDPFAVLVQMSAAERGFPGPWGQTRELAGIVIGIHLAFALACIVLAASSVRRVHLASVGEGARRSKRARWQLWRPALGNHPMLWKELHAERGFTRLGWVANIAIALLFLSILAIAGTAFIYALSERQMRIYSYWAWGLGVAIVCITVLLAAVRGSTVITSEHERDCWTSLLSTPLSPREIFGAKVWGNVYSQRWLGALLLLLWGVACLGDPAFLLVTPFFAVTGLLLTIFASCLGVWFSLIARNTLRSLLATACTILFVGGFYWVFCLMCCGLVFFATGPGPAGEVLSMMGAFCIPFLQAIPGILWTVAVQHDRFNSELVTMVFTYVIGVVGYAVATAVIWNNGVSEFDRRVGRARPRNERERLMARG